MIQRDKLLEVFNFRYACKRFSPNKEIPQEDFRVILESARLSPSSFGFEPWKFLVLKDEALKKALKPVCWGGENALENASEFIVILARKRVDLLPDSAYIQYMVEEVQKLPSEIQKVKKEFFHRFLAQDFTLLEDERKIFDWAGKQCYIALANMLTAAAALGIDSCAIEGFNEEGANEVLSKVVDITHFGVCVMVAFGYRDNDKNANRPKNRQSLEKIVQHV